MFNWNRVLDKIDNVIILYAFTKHLIDEGIIDKDKLSHYMLFEMWKYFIKLNEL
jgi:hypothetical protein